MSKLYAILGKSGCIVIPHEIRVRRGLAYNDILSFEETEDGIVVRKEKVCDRTNITANRTASAAELTLFDVLSALNPSEQKAAYCFLEKRISEAEAP